jgi:hypothetical protein
MAFYAVAGTTITVKVLLPHTHRLVEPRWRLRRERQRQQQPPPYDEPKPIALHIYCPLG